jgi:hypothetical protein
MSHMQCQVDADTPLRSDLREAPTNRCMEGCMAQHSHVHVRAVSVKKWLDWPARSASSSSCLTCAAVSAAARTTHATHRRHTRPQ